MPQGTEDVQSCLSFRRLHEKALGASAPGLPLTEPAVLQHGPGAGLLRARPEVPPYGQQVEASEALKAQAPSSAQSQLVREPPSTASVPHDSPLRLQSEVSACLQHQVEALLVQGRSALEDSSLESSFSTRSQLVREFPSTALVHHATADLKRYSAGLLRFCPEVSAPAPHAEVSQVQGLPALSMASLASPSFAQSQLVRGSPSTAPVHDGPYVPCMAPAWLWEPPFLCVRRDDSCRRSVRKMMTGRPALRPRGRGLPSPVAQVMLP